MLTNSISANAPNEANSGTWALLVTARAIAKMAGTTTAASTDRLTVTSPGSRACRNATGCRRPGLGASRSPASAPPGTVVASCCPDRTDMLAVSPPAGRRARGRRSSATRHGPGPRDQALDRNRCPRDEVRGRRGEEQVRLRDVGDLGPGGVVGVRHRAPVGRGVDDAGNHAVDGDLAAPHLVGGHGDQMKHAQLADRVGESLA